MSLLLRFVYGNLEDNSRSEQRLMHQIKIEEDDLFLSPETLVERAYDIQSEKIAYCRVE